MRQFQKTGERTLWDGHALTAIWRLFIEPLRSNVSDQKFHMTVEISSLVRAKQGQKHTIYSSSSPRSIVQSLPVARQYRNSDHTPLFPSLMKVQFMSANVSPILVILSWFSQSNISHLKKRKRKLIPSASVVPLVSTTCISASACLKSSKNLFPRPRPSWAPGTKPATSSNSIGTERIPSVQEP
jgi:hypothetical protein